MTTLSNSTAFVWGNTANLQAMGAELHGWLQTVGLVQTADTGQVNWTTVTYPATASTVIGYEIWRFADSSIYFKMEWSTPATTLTNRPLLYLTVGSGSDGAGSITGITFTRASIVTGATSSGPSTPTPTYICHTTDYFAIAYKFGAVANYPCVFSFVIEKMLDNSGAVSSNGIVVTYQGANGSALSLKRAIRTASPATDFGLTNSFCLVTNNVTSSLQINGDKLVWPHRYIDPAERVSKFLLTVVAAEASPGTTFTHTPVDGVSHTYLSIGTALGTGNSASAAATWTNAMLWE